MSKYVWNMLRSARKVFVLHTSIAVHRLLEHMVTSFNNVYSQKEHEVVGTRDIL